MKNGDNFLDASMCRCKYSRLFFLFWKLRIGGKTKVFIPICYNKSYESQTINAVSDKQKIRKLQV